MNQLFDNVLTALVPLLIALTALVRAELAHKKVNKISVTKWKSASRYGQNSEPPVS